MTTKTKFDDKELQSFACLLQNELHEGLQLYWDIANAILNKSRIRLNIPSNNYFSLENNFFSALFLYSYHRGGISKTKRVLFAAVNQCLRGMVTGCDNILDNEYKRTLDTDLPINATKFRSILDIMVSDRILTAIMYKGYMDGKFAFDSILAANTASLHGLLRSGVQEASEEGGAGDILQPQDILGNIHSMKTGILFHAPWVIPELTENINRKLIEEIKDGLFHIGMGCQVMDDMVDLSIDTKMNRHNYVASLIWHGQNSLERDILKAYLTSDTNAQDEPDFMLRFPDARQISTQKALDLLTKGTELLFEKKHKFMVNYSINFFATRIGAHRFLSHERVSP